MQYPLKGLQGYYLQQLPEILKEISRRMDAPMGKVDLDAASEEINDIQTELPAKKLALELRPEIRFPNWLLRFAIVNGGNRDVQLLEVKIRVPSAILSCPYRPMTDPTVLEVGQSSDSGVQYTVITYGNHRKGDAQHVVFKTSLVKVTTEPLCTDLAPGMESVLQPISIEARCPLAGNELQHPIKYQIFAKNVTSVERFITLDDKLVVPQT